MQAARKGLGALEKKEQPRKGLERLTSKSKSLEKDESV